MAGPSIAGPEIARRSRPGELRAGVLTVLVDNSPWLQEVTLRSTEILAAPPGPSRIRGHVGALRAWNPARPATAGHARPASARRSPQRRGGARGRHHHRPGHRPRARRLGAAPRHQGPDRASAARRCSAGPERTHMSRPTWSIVPCTPGLAAAGLLLVLGGCATSAPAPAPEPGRAEVPSPAAVVKRPSAGGRTASAYWHFSKAQMEAREGRLQDAVSELRLAIKDDPNTAALWVQLSQWLARTEDVTGAIEAAQKGHRARVHQRDRPSGPGRPVPAPAALGRRRARARAGHRARPRRRRTRISRSLSSTSSRRATTRRARSCSG